MKISIRNWERNYNFRSSEKPKCIPGNDHHNCSIDEQHSSEILLNPYNLWDMVPAAPISLNQTNDRDSMSNQYPQPTPHQTRTDSYPVFPSLRTLDSKKEGIEHQVCNLSKILPTGWTKKRNSCCGWKFVWSMETRSNGWNFAVFDKLYLYLNVATSFSCLIYIFFWCKFCCFFACLFFRFLSLTNSSEN